MATVPASGVAAPRRRRTAVATAPDDRNLAGQRLGRKGRDTRERILAAAAELLADPQASAITLSAVARGAGLGLSSLYNYFADLTELLLAMLEPVMATADDAYIALLREHWPDAGLGERTLAFVHAYHGFWVRNSRLLHLRNSMADHQDERLMIQRVDSVRPLMRLLVRQMEAPQDGTDPMAASMVTALVTGLERAITVTTDDNLQTILKARFSSTHSHLLEAEARLLELGVRDYRQRVRGLATG